MSNETITPRQKLFNYLSKELGALALETDLIAIERIVIDGQKIRIECYREWQEHEDGFESDGWINSKTDEIIDLLEEFYEEEKILDTDKFGNPTRAILVKAY